MRTTERGVAGASPQRSGGPLLPVAAVLAVALGVLGFVTRLTDPTPWRTVGNDLAQDHLSARALADGDSPYTPTSTLLGRYLPDLADDYGPTLPDARTPHPPAMIVAHRPLAGIPFATARVGWLAAMAAAMALGVGLVARAAGLSVRASVVVGIGTLALPVAQKDLIYAQAHGILLLLLAVGWRALRARRDAWSGAALGIAAALKLFPAFMIVPLLAMRRFRAAAWMAAVAAAVSVAGAAVVGWADTWLFVSDVAPANLRDWRPAPMNVSLGSIPYRWLTPNLWRDGTIDLPVVAAALALLAFGACVVAGWRTAGATSGDPFWEAVPWMLLASPIAWDNYLVLTVPLAVLMVARHARERTMPRVAVAIALTLMLVGAPVGLPSAPDATDLQQVLGFSLPMYGLVIYGALSFRRRVLLPAVARTGPEPA